MRCSGDEISLVNAFPANGYQLTVDNGGPKQVTVSFSGDGTAYQISAVCQNGSPVRVEGGSGDSPEVVQGQTSSGTVGTTDVTGDVPFTDGVGRHF